MVNPGALRGVREGGGRVVGRVRGHGTGMKGEGERGGGEREVGEGVRGT